jgi:hypothetical protein
VDAVVGNLERNGLVFYFTVVGNLEKWCRYNISGYY